MAGKFEYDDRVESVSGRENGMTALSSHHAVYVGSFDPLTLGHVDIIRRAAVIFDRVTVGIGMNPEKRALFSPDERLSLAELVLRPFPNVKVHHFSGLTVEFIRQCGARVLVRGVRSLSDIESEFTMTLANRALDPEIDTVFLMAGERYSHISSSLIKQIAQLSQGSGAARLRDFVPVEVVEPLLAKYKPADPATSG